MRRYIGALDINTQRAYNTSPEMFSLSSDSARERRTMYIIRLDRQLLASFEVEWVLYINAGQARRPGIFFFLCQDERRVSVNGREMWRPSRI